MNFKSIFLIALLLTISTISLSTGPEPTGSAQPNPKHIKSNNPGEGFPRGFFGPVGGFNIPGMGSGWSGGYGVGYGDPEGDHSESGVIWPSVVCKEKGRCYKKKLTCPAKCFGSYSHSSKSYSSGGAGGGCTMDCEKCVAYC